MQLTLEFSTKQHLDAVYAYYERTKHPGSHVDVPAQSTPNGNGMPVATYSGPLHTGTPAATGLVDGAGVPWNGDFHASTKTQTLKGRWKARKGRDENAAVAYEAPYLNGSNTPQPADACRRLPTPADACRRLPTPAVVYPVPQPAASFSFDPPAGPSPVGCTPVEFMTLANHLMGQGKLDNAAVMRMCQEIGVTDPNALASDDMARAKIYGQLMVLAS